MRFLTKTARGGGIYLLLVGELGKKVLRVEAHDAGDLDELDHVDSSFAGLDASDEGVQTLQARREVTLRQARLLAALDQNVYQGAVTLGAQGLPQRRLRHGALWLEIGAPSITQGVACSQ